MEMNAADRETDRKIQNLTARACSLQIESTVAPIL